jgi:uncharacterized protein (DUF362 family)
MERRRFCKIAALGMSSAFFPNLWSHSGFAIAQDDAPTVWESKGNADDMVPALFKALGNIFELTNKKLDQTTVLIKPNLCLPHQPDTGTTTSPQLVKAFCQYLTDAGVKKIIIADHTLKAKTESFQKTEVMQATADFPGVRWILANEQRYFTPQKVEGKVLKKTELLKIVKRADLTINLATAKHHSATQVSLCTKNLMGLIWDRISFHTQLDLHQAIGDLALVVRPTLNVVDASRVLLNGGPTGPGPVVQENRMFVSLDPVTVDTVLLSRYDFGGRQLSASEVAHILAAYKNGIGEIDLNKINVQKV